MCFSYVCSVCACLDLSVSSSSWGLGRAAVCDCGTSWTFPLPFFYNDDLKKLASAMVDREIKRSIILKPRGCGFFGGTIIRSLIRWELVLVLFMRLFGLCLFGFVGFLFLLVGEGGGGEGRGRLRFVIVALPGLFSYLFYGNKLMRKFGKTRSTRKSFQKTKKPSKKSKQVSKKFKKSRKTTKKMTQKCIINGSFITFRKCTPPRKQFTPPSPLSSLPSPPSSTRSLVNSILQDMHKTPQKTSPTISRFSPFQPMSQAGKIGYQATMRQLGYHQPFRVAGQPNLKFTRRKLHL